MSAGGNRHHVGACVHSTYIQHAYTTLIQYTKVLVFSLVLSTTILHCTPCLCFWSGLPKATDGWPAFPVQSSVAPHPESHTRSLLPAGCGGAFELRDDRRGGATERPMRRLSDGNVSERRLRWAKGPAEHARGRDLGLTRFLPLGRHICWSGGDQITLHM